MKPSINAHVAAERAAALAAVARVLRMSEAATLAAAVDIALGRRDCWEGWIKAVSRLSPPADSKRGRKPKDGGKR